MSIQFPSPDAELAALNKREYLENSFSGGVSTPSYDISPIVDMQTYQAPAPVFVNPPNQLGYLGRAQQKVGNYFQSKLPNAYKGFTKDVDKSKEWYNQTKKETLANYGELDFKDRGALWLGGLQTAAGLYNSYKTSKMAKKQFNFTKEAYNRNFAAQAKVTNSQLADRQAARHARDPKQHASVADYMKKYGV